MWTFQFFPSPGETTEPAMITVDDNILSLLSNKAEALISKDPSFREALLEAMRKGRVRRPERKLEDVIAHTVEIAKYRLRKDLSGKSFSGPFALSNKLLEVVTEAQTMALAQAADAMDSKQMEDQVLSRFGSKLESILDRETLEKAERELEAIGEEERSFAKDQLALRYLHGQSAKKLLDELRQELPEWMEYKLLSIERDRVVSMCKRMVADGQMYRFEMSEIMDILDLISQRPLPREKIAQRVEQFVSRRLS